MKLGNLVEILAVFVLIIGAGLIVAAASIISTALACLAAGTFLLVAGVIGIYVASTIDVTAPKTDPNRASQ